MTIIATPGASNANSFGTLAEAVTYFSSRKPRPWTWFTTESDDREYALLQGAIDVNEINFIGDKATTTQALEWPRIINDTYKLINDTFPFADNVVPANIKYAQFETALYHLEVAVNLAAGTGLVSSLKIGKSVEVKYAPTTTIPIRALVLDPHGIPIRAAQLMKGLRIIPILA